MSDSSLATVLGLSPLGPVPGDLPDSWLMRLEEQAEAIDSALEASAYRVVMGEGGEDEGALRALARSWIFTDELAAALHDRIPHEVGLRRRWLEALHRRCVKSRIEGDAEIVALVGELERMIWGFHADLPADLPDDEAARLRAMALRQRPLAEACQPTLIRLFKRRNTLARAEGAANYFEWMMAAHEAPWDWLEPLLQCVKAATEAPYARYFDWLEARVQAPISAMWELRAAGRAHTLIPAERLARIELDRLREADAALGLPAIGVPHRLEVRPFGAGGYCSVINPKSDVRIAIDSTRPRHTALAILLHEYGHALHAAVMGRGPLPYHLRTMLLGEPGPVCEAMSTMLESLKSEPAWMATVSDASEAELADWSAAGRGLDCQALRYNLMGTAFDRAVYEDPDQDLDGLYLALQRDYMRLDPPEEAGALWAAGPMTVTFPCYQVCYVLADMAVAQLREALSGTLWGNPRVGGFLAEHFWEPAGAVPWRDRLNRATGRPLGPEALLAHLTV